MKKNKIIIFFVVLSILYFTMDSFSQEMSNLESFFYRCKYAKSDVVKKALDQIVSPLGKVANMDYLNAVIVYDSKENITAIKEYMKQIDVYVPQIFVDARIVEITVDSDTEYDISHTFTSSSGANILDSKSGITLGVPGANPSTGQGLNLLVQPFSKDFGKLNESLRLLVTSGRAKILSSPNLVVDYGNEGSIITGEKVPLVEKQIVGGAISTSTKFTDIGIKLKVTPIQITEDSVRLSVNPEVSTVTGYTTGETSNPKIAVRSTDTVLTVKNGEVISIGGLLSSEERRIEKKVPLLGDIPILGLLFRSERNQSVRTQLMFFLKIDILKEGEQRGRRIFDLSVPEQAIDEQINKIEERVK